MNLIKIKNLKKSFGMGELTTEILHNLSFQIKQGEFLSIMWPSGSGKSTLMHILGLLDKASAGEYLFEEENVTDLSDSKLATIRNQKIGFVFQAFHLLPKTTVIENVMLPLTYAKNPGNMEKRATEVLEKVWLSHRLHHYTNQISGGEKQRTAIARALVNNPSVIFADEPTGNLDSKSGQQVMELLQNLNNEGNTIILVTHETHTAQHADRILSIHDGKIISDTPVKDKIIAKKNHSLEK